MGRPAKGPLATLPTGMRETILQMRRMHPGWGPTTLLAELQVDARWTDQPLPSRSRIAAGLRTEHLTRRYQKHSELPIPVIQPEGAPHDEWELDAQGSMQVAGVGKVCLITMIDVISRWHRSRAIPASIRPIPPVARLSTHAETCLHDLWTAPAHLVGSRNRLLRQHLAVAVSHQSASVVAGGWRIDVCFTRKRCPTDHAKIERTHQTMTLQARHGPALVRSNGTVGRTRCASSHARVSIFRVRSSRIALPYRPIPKRRTRGSLLPSRMGGPDARSPAGLCVSGHLSLVSAHSRQRAARPWEL